MKTTNSKKITILLCAILAITFVLFTTGLLEASEPDQKQSSQVTKKDLNNNVSTQRNNTQNEGANAVIQDALKAYDETITAAEALDKNDKKTASEALERAIGKLDVVLGGKQKVALIPISSKVETIDLVPNLQSIEERKTEAEFLLKQGHIQAARRLIDSLASEIRITTANLPMETYPIALRGIARTIEENKIDEAKLALRQVLSTVVLVERSIPIPVLNSQYLIAQSQKITEEAKGQELTQEKKNNALAMLRQAEVELEVAEELGYGKRDREFKEIRDDIKEIENKIVESKVMDNSFDKLKERLNIFKNKISN